MVDICQVDVNAIKGDVWSWALGMQITIATLAGITWYNAFELVILVFVTFSQYSGLYFWSLLVSSSVGLIPYSLGFLLKFFDLAKDESWLPLVLLTIGWWCMVTGQSVVLYSRLHLVTSNQAVLRRVLIMIVVDAVILHVPTTVFTFGANLVNNLSPSLRGWLCGYNFLEKFQMTGFCIQEFIISGLYIYETVRMLRLDKDRAKAKIQWQLLVINAIIVIMDIGLLVAEYRGYYMMETMLKGAVYSIKLKLDWRPESVPSPHDFPDFVDVTRVTTDVTHAPSSYPPRRPSWMDSDAVSIAMFEHMPPPSERPSGSEMTSTWSRESHIHPHDFTTPLRPSRLPSVVSSLKSERSREPG
ncbi:hypothetical protein N7470_008677 [Penicillium chermesinum]|nr:hypothetical protein N7470_008677 [Penicillium chermesinum]